MSPDTKPSNPKDAIGSKKVGTHVIPSVATMEMALAFIEGGCKYGSHNFRDAGVRSSVYYDAIDRHMKDWWEGANATHDSKVHPLGHVMACCAIILDGIAQGNLTDDRPPAMTKQWLLNFNDRAREIIERFPDPVAPFTQADLDYVKANHGGPFVDQHLDIPSPIFMEEVE